jgi:hypothetical protein
MTREIIVLDGVKIDLREPDLDKDGITGKVEVLNNPNFVGGETEIITPNNDSELIKELNRDELEGEMGMSSIDMKANLYPIEHTAIMAFNSLVSFRFLPKNCLPFTRVKLRLSRSLILPRNIEGVGGRQSVEMITGKKELDAKSGFNLFGNKQQNNQVVQK